MTTTQILFILILCVMVGLSTCVLDPYKALGVTKGASKEEIKRAYKNLALKWHPDKTDSEEADKKYVEINTAYDILTDEDKLREYEMSQQYQNHRNQRASQGWQSFFKTSFPPIFSETMWVTYENYDYLVTSDDVWIIEFYSDRCVPCADHASEWELTAKSFKHFAKFGRINTDEESVLSRNFRVRTIPTIVAMVGKHVHHYRGGLDHYYLSEFVNSVLPHKVIILTAHREFVNFLEIEKNTKVKILLFSTHKKDGISALYKHVSMKYADFINFAQTNPYDALDVELVEKYNVVTRPSLVIFKENSEEPVVYAQALNKETLEKIIEENKFLVVPEISLSNFNYICGKKTKYNFCGLIINNTTKNNNKNNFDDSDDVLQKISRIRTLASHLEKQERIPKVKFGVVSSGFEKLAEVLNMTRKGEKDTILFLDGKRGRHVLYNGPYDVASMEMFLRTLTSSYTRFVETPRNLPSLMVYPQRSDSFDYSTILAIPQYILHFIINNFMISVIMLFTVLRLCLRK